MPAPYYSPIPQTTPYEYIGEPQALGSLALTKLANSFAELDKTDLAFLFPDQHNPERTIVIETMQESLGLMPLARPGVPVGNFLPNNRMFRRIVEPAIFREDDFIDQYLINQLKMPGTMNSLYPPQKIVEERVRLMVSRHNRTIDFFRTQVLLGGIFYEDPRTSVKIDVPTQIPAHNFFKYNGFTSSEAVGYSASVNGTTYDAATALEVKGRTEALLFTSTDQKFGVPWTHPNADIVRCCRLIKQIAKNTNKNVYTDIFMSGDLYTLIQENQDIKARSGGIGYVNYEINTTDKGLAPATTSGSPSFITFGPGGDIDSIAGLKIHVMDQLFTDPVDNKVKNMWPSNKVVIVARSHVNDPGQTLGYTQYCVGESPDMTSGLWVRTGPDQAPPNTPGRTLQMGDSFLPYAMYPHWILVLDVCEPEDIDTKLILRSNLSYGVF